MQMRRFVLLGLLGLALLPRMGDLRADAQPPEVRALKDELRRNTALAERYARLLSACLNGQTLFVGEDMVFCDRHTVRIAK
jgi:hypothetical protein